MNLAILKADNKLNVNQLTGFVFAHNFSFTNNVFYHIERTELFESNVNYHLQSLQARLVYILSDYKG